MNDLDQRIIGSFDALKAPESAKASALAHIEAVRHANQTSEGSGTSQLPTNRTATSAQGAGRPPLPPASSWHA